MSSTKNIVKVMNFHSLIRVDKAKKRASKYNEVEKELTRNLAALVYNRNLNVQNKLDLILELITYTRSLTNLLAKTK